jgi:hypothetical protein
VQDDVTELSMMLDELKKTLPNARLLVERRRIKTRAKGYGMNVDREIASTIVTLLGDESLDR